MEICREVRVGRTLIGRLACGDDLLEAITTICQRAGIGLGRVEAIGAVRRARLGYYDQEKREYRFRNCPEPLELACLTGNVSRKDGEPIVHAHVTLCDEGDKTVGGHLAPGTEVFACEYVIHELTGTELSRGLDEETGLPLWKDT